MGSLLGSMTNPGVQSPGGGSQFFDPSQVQSGAMAKALTPQPGSLQPQGTNNPQGAPPPMPQAVHPSFLQATQMGESTPGAVNAMSPGLSKAGKLVTLLTGGLKGAMAGEAASAQAVQQSGGRRGGNVGSGFQAGYQEPIQEAMRGQQLKQAEAQTQLTQAQGQMVPTPYGMMPAALARFILPASIKEQGAEKVQGMKGGTAEAVQGEKGQTALQVAGINKRFMTVPNVGLIDTATRQVVPGSEQGIPVSPEIANDYGLPKEYIGKPLPLSVFSGLERGQDFQNKTVEGAGGPAVVNTRTKEVTPLNLGNPSQGRPTQVADPDNPGNTKFVTGGQAIQSGAAGPQSAAVQVPRAAEKAAIPTKIGDQKVAFNTAMAHADLLKQAMTALNNGDVRTLNSLKNRFKTEFGSPDVTNAQAITNAYSREITKMLSAGHMTDAEIGSSGATMPTNASPQQMLGVLDAYKNLAASKMKNLQGQVATAVSASQPKKAGGAPAANGGGFAAWKAGQQ